MRRSRRRHSERHRYRRAGGIKMPADAVETTLISNSCIVCEDSRTARRRGWRSASLVVGMDCDVQYPPGEIPRLYANALEGYDVVLSRREERVQSVPRRLAASAYFRLHNMIARGNLHTIYTNLSVISRKVVDSFLALRDQDRHYMLIRHSLS